VYGAAPVNNYYDGNGNLCSAAGPGCDYNSYGTLINVGSDPYYVTGAGEETGQWTSPDGISYSNGTPLNEADITHGKDSITNGAAAKQAAIADNANRLQAKYSLSADTSMRVATAMSDWAVLGQSRKRTAADQDAFSKRLSGMDIGEVNAALESAKSGDLTAFNQAINKAASNWSTSPDTMKHIVGDWFAAQNANKQ
jgi:hypothetical protein